VLRPLAARVTVAHPGQLRLIFRSMNKNDRNDAERLEKLLYLGETPTVHVPAPEVRAWRELVNRRSQPIAKRTRAKNAVRALLRGAGVVPRGDPACGRRRGWRGSAGWSCPRPASSGGGTRCSRRSRRSHARCRASNSISPRSD
jgi:transposase